MTRQVRLTLLAVVFTAALPACSNRDTNEAAAAAPSGPDDELVTRVTALEERVRRLEERVLTLPPTVETHEPATATTSGAETASAAVLESPREPTGAEAVEPPPASSPLLAAPDPALEAAAIEAIRSAKSPKKIKTPDGVLAVDKFRSGRTWSFDRYGDRYFQVEADRGEAIWSVDFEFTARDKDPRLPMLLAIGRDGERPTLLAALSIRFYRWEDYSTYLGTYHDSRNDFAKRETVKFTAGASLDAAVLDKDFLLIGVVPQRCMKRSYKRFDHPPLSYPPDVDLLETCLPLQELTWSWIAENIVPIEVRRAEHLPRLEATEPGSP